ncbi:MAG: hypothetical protein HN704_14615 [Bacteroidetes bacterium]|jgi:hypothetical protein|nr:hypothetical protein [Bacteroidota bacterium]MBT7492830.1 hypothetical protein [Bacteroidota bacterium]
MSIFSKIIGSEKVMNIAAKGIDKVFFTKQEKAANWINTLKAYEPYKIAQRLIALIVTCVYLFVWILSAILLAFSVWFETIEAAKILAELNNNTLSLPFSLIIGFYFAGGVAEGIINKIKKK